MTLKFNIPTNWNSLSNAQLLKIAKLFFSNKKTILFDYNLFKIMANHKWYKLWLLRKIILLFKNVPVKTIQEDFNYIYKEQNLTRFIPVIKIGKKKYYAPANRLSNLSIGEFSVCEDLYLGYLRNCKNSKSNYGKSYLLYLFAVLYINSSKAKRPAFSRDNLQFMVAKIEKVPNKYVLAALLSYKGCRDAIASNPKYKHIFPNKKTEPKTVLKIPTSSGFSDVILSFSNKIFGNYHETFKTNVYTFLDGYELTIANTPKNATT